jgi:hypothetical protein
MVEIIENPSTIKKKALKSIQRIKDYHCPKIYSKNLENIYDKIK